MAVTHMDVAPARARPLQKAATHTRPIIFFLFIVSLMTPIVINVGTFALPPSRLFILLMFFPSVYLWVSGRAGPWRPFDYVMIFSAFWAVLSITLNHGFASYQRSGFFFLEMIGSYMFARAFVRSVEDFRCYMKYVMLGLLFMLPFGVIETQTGDPIIIVFLSNFIQTEPIIDHQVRLGMERSQVVFPHPILYGMFCASMLGVVARGMNYKSGFMASAGRIGVVTVNTICSVSSGAWMGFIAQTGLLIYDRVLKNVPRRWLILLFTILLAYLFVEVAAKSSPAKVFVRYFTLNPASGHYRILQFDYAMQSIAADPIFGRGFRGVPMPRWMTSSLDNYWLVLTTRFGVVMFVSFLGGILYNMYKLGKMPLADPWSREIRTGYLISLAGFLLAATTVHVWSNVNVWFMFFLGAGMWMFDAPRNSATAGGADLPAGNTGSRLNRQHRTPSPEAGEPVGAEPERAVPAGRYTRFPTSPRAPVPRNGRGRKG